MSLLTPLYIAAALAIALPILFHLIRRTPQGRQPFSSLMFLSPSPPRMTRRSRLNNVFLLLLRALVLALLAFAFARPLFRQEADLNVGELQGRRLALLMDTSASMQRGDLWQQALRQADEVLRNISPADEVSLYTFDRHVRLRMSASEWRGMEPSRRVALLKARLADVTPTWSATNLGDALAATADALADASDADPNAVTAARQVILISDLQQGSRLESLQGHQWPEGVLLDVKPVALAKSAEAAIALVKAEDVDAESSGVGKLGVRIINQPHSTREQFSLAWQGAQGPLKHAEPISAYVPPGTSRVLHLDWPDNAAAADRLVLSGDDHEFDNTLYLVPPRQETVRIVYLGDETADDAQGLRYFLETAAVSNARRAVEFVVRDRSMEVAPADLLEARLVVAAATITASQAEPLRSWIEQGGTLLYVLKDAAAADGVARLMRMESLSTEENAAGDYALLGEIAFDHPLFMPLSDPRFSDFTKIRFWKHRRVQWPKDHAARVLARFDRGDPFLLEHTIGTGHLLVATSGWHPADSQLARSTKFVPMLDALIDRPQAGYMQSQHTLDEPIELPPATTAVRQLTDPSGQELELAAAAANFTATRPGVYRLVFEERETKFAVNLESDESRTMPLEQEDLESRGARLGSQPTVQEVAQRQRQLRLIELENRQKLWRWLIVIALGVLVVETALAGYLARRLRLAESTPPVASSA